MRLDFYPAEELEKIMRRSAGLLGIGIDDSGASAKSPAVRAARPASPTACSSACAITPKCAPRSPDARPTIDRETARAALALFEVDERGLDWMDRKLLSTIIEKFDGGPVGIETLSSALGEERDTLEDVYEPYLIQEGLIQRTPRGRVATQSGYRHLGLSWAERQTLTAVTKIPQFLAVSCDRKHTPYLEITVFRITKNS